MRLARRVTLGIIYGILAALITGGLLAGIAGPPRVEASAQVNAVPRLQIHGVIADANVNSLLTTVRVTAVCDTGNGTMLYIISKEEGNIAPIVRMQRNGCNKLPAER